MQILFLPNINVEMSSESGMHIWLDAYVENLETII